jgi:hypothetical protein
MRTARSRTSGENWFDFLLMAQSSQRKEPPQNPGRFTRQLVRPIAVEWLLLKVQRSVASRDDEWQVPAAAVIGLQNLTGCSQP